MVIGISGRKRSGKDTVARIIQLVIGDADHRDLDDGQIALMVEYQSHFGDEKFIQVEKLTKPLIRAVSGLTGIAVDQLESYKDTIIPQLSVLLTYRQVYIDISNAAHARDPEFLVRMFDHEHFPKAKYLWAKSQGNVHCSSMSGTLCGLVTLGNNYANQKTDTVDCPECLKLLHPDMIITDLRLRHQADYVRHKKAGIVIRVQNPKTDVETNEPIENDLDTYQFDFIINNDGSFLDLVQEVRIFVNKFIILNNHA